MQCNIKTTGKSMLESAHWCNLVDGKISFLIPFRFSVSFDDIQDMEYLLPGHHVSIKHASSPIVEKTKIFHKTDNDRGKVDLP